MQLIYDLKPRASFFCAQAYISMYASLLENHCKRDFNLLQSTYYSISTNYITAQVIGIEELLYEWLE
jgi:hypothetical protein